MSACSVMETVRLSGAGATCLQWRKIRLRNFLKMQIRQTQACGTYWDGSHPTRAVGAGQYHCKATVFERSWQLVIPGDWGKANATPII